MEDASRKEDIFSVESAYNDDVEYVDEKRKAGKEMDIGKGC